MEILCGLVGFAFVLFGIAVIGHLLWLAGAAVFGTSSPPPARSYCPACTAQLQPGQTRCPACGTWTKAAIPTQGTLDDELAVTRRQLRRLMLANKLPETTWAQIVEAIRADVRERELGVSPAAIPLEIVDIAPPAQAEPTVPPAETPVMTPIAASAAVEGILAASTVEPATPAEAFVGATSTFEPVPALAERPRQQTEGRRALADLFQAFMEEKNIRWGELISGLLIVGSSVGLVISLWATLKEAIPYFPVAVFLTATCAMHGAGLYTLRRWRLKTTSRGLLLVSTLLIPLNVLAAMVLNEKKPVYESIDYGAFAIGLSVLAALAVSAARVLNRHNPWPMVVAVVGTAVGMSTIGRLARPGDELGRTLALFALPFFSFLVGAIAHIVSLSQGRHLTIRRVAQSFRFFGIAAFGLVLAGGLLASKGGEIRETLTFLSPMLAVVGAALAGAGLVVHQRIVNPEQAAFRIAGTSLALGGGFLAAVALALAFPRPDLLVAVGLLDALTFTLLAWFAAFPALHVFATASFSVAFWVGLEWATGEISVVGATPELLLSLLLTARSALILTLLSLAADGIGCFVARFKTRTHANAYFTSAIIHEAVALAIAAGAVWRDLPDQDLATAVFALAAIRWLIAVWSIRRSYAGWIAASLLFAALGHGLVMNDALAEMLTVQGLYPAGPRKMFLLLHATICLGCALLARRIAGGSLPAPEERRRSLGLPFVAAALATSALAVPMVLDMRHGHFATHGVYAFWTSALWFVIAVLEVSPALAIAAQVLATVGVGLAVTGSCRRQIWWTGSPIDPLFLNWELGALACWSVLLMAARRLGLRVAVVDRVLTTGRITVDRVVLAAVVRSLVGSCFVATLPGVMDELAAVVSSSAGARPLVAVVLIPFAIGAILCASRALFSRLWPAVTGLTFTVLLLCVGLFFSPWSTVHWPWPGTPNPYGLGWAAGAWVALLLAVIGVLAAHWERPGRTTLTGLTLLLSVVPLLVACRWDAELGTASALRWASVFLALAAAGAFALPEVFARFVNPQAGDGLRDYTKGAIHARNALVGAATLVVLILTSQQAIVLLGLGGLPGAPIAGSLFAQIGTVASLGGPLVLLALSFVLCAAADRSPLWGLAATFLGQLALGLMLALSLALSPHSPSAAELVRFLQEIGLSSVFAVVLWQGLQRVLRPGLAALDQGDSALERPIAVQLGFVAVFMAILTGGATAGLWMSPAPVFNCVRESGAPLGWLFLVSAAGVWAWSHRGRWPLSAIQIGLLLLSAAAVFGAASLGRWNTADNWLAFHAAMGGWCAVLALAAAATLVTRSPERRIGRVAIADRTLLLLPVILGFAFKAELFDPQRPWWAAGTMIFLSACVTAIAVGAGSRLRSYLSLVFAVLASAFIGVRPWLESGHAVGRQSIVDLVQIIVLGMGLHGIVWLALELMRGRSSEQAAEESWTAPLEKLSAPPVHHSVAAIGTLAIAFTAVVVLLNRAFVPQISSATFLGWEAAATLAVLAAGSLWERRSEHSFPILYSLGIVAIAMALDWRQLAGRSLIYASAASLAGYVVLSGVFWSVRRPLKEFGLRLKMSPFSLDGQRVAPWLGPVSLAIGALVIGVEFWVVLTFADTSLRIGAALATLAVGGGLALLATTRARDGLQVVSLAVGAIAVVQFGWSLMDPLGGATHEELRHTIRMMAMLGTTTFVYGLPLVRLVRPESPWFGSIRRAAVGVAAATIATLALVLLFEISAFDPTAGAPVTVGESLLVASTLVLLAAGLVSLAVLPGHDPFLQAERQRSLYVYASEAVCGLLFAHLYLTNPHFFRHNLQPYWPLIVMAIAYGGTAVSELFRRMKLKVLAEPLEYSSAFLPVLPVVGLWLLSSNLSYSTTLVVVGLLYLFLSLRRGSFVYTAAAAVVGNATLCTLFSEQGVSLLLHPQMFVIPPCLTILAAAQINREHLDPKVLASLRYFAITMIYVSSTGEMFHHGIGKTLWLPMVLAGLSVLGVLAGIVLRVRAFLYLGTSFLSLSIVSMVWHASRSIGHVWPWWVFLFTLGVGLLTLFGVFEKKRPEVLALVGSLREWER
jgi:hypothetical protein